MPSVLITLPDSSYQVLIEPGALEQLGDLVEAANSIAAVGCCGLIVDRAVKDTHALAAQKSLKKAGYSAAVLTIQPGEENKSLAAVQSLLSGLLDNHLDRKSPVIALGGGITTDVGGFVAASYM